jgi:hypothetical protein
VADLEGLAGVADEELGVGRDGALVDAEQAQLAAEGVVADLEDVGDDVLVGVGGGADRLGGRAFALQELGRVAFGGVGQQAAHDVEQLGDAGARAGRGEAHRDQVAFAQGLLEGVVELLGLQRFALLEVEGHQVFVHLDHLVDDLVVGLAHAGEGRHGVVVGREEAVDDRSPPAVGRLIGRHSLPKAARRRSSSAAKSTPGASMRLTTIIRHFSAAASIALRVTVSTPAAALTTTTAVSTAGSVASARPRKSGMPGVSSTFTQWPAHSRWARLGLREWPEAFSWGRNR